MIDIFSNGGHRNYYLRNANNQLSLIQPKSVESEKCFLSAGYICNKFMSRIKDTTLNALIFLRLNFYQTKFFID